MSDSSMKTSTLKNNSENMVTLFKNASLSNLSRIFLKSGFKKTFSSQNSLAVLIER